MSHHVVDYDQEGRPTLATRSDNRATLAFAFLGGGAGRSGCHLAELPANRGRRRGMYRVG
jgi:hypothetical protein